MLVPYTPLSELSEAEKRKALNAPRDKSFVVLGDKVVNLKELQKPPVPPVRQKLFE